MPSARLISRLRRIDWDFAGSYSDSPFSAIHWHPGRFASQLPATLIGLLSRPGQLVVDPFAGSGTTLVEAQRLSRRSVGIDLNPISCLVARAKTMTVPAKAIENSVKTIKEDAAGHVGRQMTTSAGPRIDPLVPDAVQAKKWYTHCVAESLGVLWHLLQAHRGTERILAEAAFSAILLPVCRETRHWGYVCDNSSPKGRHEGNVLDEYCRLLDRLCEGYRDRDAELVARLGRADDILEEAKVVCADARVALQDIPAGSVDLVVTSPPYFGVTDYVKAQRLSMEWFGFAIEPFRRMEIGARSKRHRGSADNDYVAELTAVFRSVRKCLRPGGICAVIVGESSTRGSILHQCREGLQSCRFSLELHVNRRVSSQRRQAPSIKSEHLFVLSR